MKDLIVREFPNKTEFEQIRLICCLTGNNGAPIEASRNKIFSEIWVGPYQYFNSKWTFVAIKENKILGYLTGCPTPNAIHTYAQKIFYIFKVITRNLFLSSDLKRFLKRSFKIEKSPNDYFSLNIKNLIKIEYPAHLHINLLPESRGQEIGKHLLNAFESALLLEKIPGIHVFCAEGPLPFYLKNGFQILEEILYLKKTKVFCLGKKL